MKYSIASLFVALALFASADAKKKKLKKPTFTGNCTALTDTIITVETSYVVTDDIVFPYPCSGGYLPNFAANKNFLKDVRNAINEAGNELGIDADCANLCDISNGSYSTVDGTVTGVGSLEDNLRFPNIFCKSKKGILNNVGDNDDFNKGDGDDSPCRCDPDEGYLSGCYECSGTVTFSLQTCLDSSAFEKFTKSGRRR